MKPEFVDLAVAELLRAAEPFSVIPVPKQAPDDAYWCVEDSSIRIYFGEVRRLRRAIEGVRALWRVP